MDETKLNDFFEGRIPIFTDKAIWDDGDIELGINYYLSDEIPPVEFISSVRAIVFKYDEVLLIEEDESEYHVIPGGRREAG